MSDSHGKMLALGRMPNREKIATFRGTQGPAMVIHRPLSFEISPQ